jgi:putative peptide zinc metalloprotease protein
MLKNVHSSAARTAGLLRIAWGDAQQAGAARPGAGPPDHSSPPALLQAGAPGPAGVPRLTGGAELLGEYKDSGYCQPPSLVRRPDGQVIQMSALLYKVTSRIDGARDAEAIAGLVSTDLGQILTADQARYLSTAKLVPLGIVASQGGPAAPAVASPLLALRARGTLLPERAVIACPPGPGSSPLYHHSLPR